MKKSLLLLLIIISGFVAAQDKTGPGGNESAPNHANYDESVATPYPDLPDLLTLKNGKRVTTPEMWWKQRRPEIAEDMEREVYGRLPGKTPPVKWIVDISESEMIGFMPVIPEKGDAPNMKYFIEWTSRLIGHETPVRQR